MNAFKKLGLTEKSVKVLEELHFSSPTDIQEKTIPLIMEGKDVIGNAATGSGKTFAFASGIIEKVALGKGIQALVMAPTRELVGQIAKVTRDFAKNTKLQVQEIYGGVGMGPQVFGAQKAEIIIGTPGRLLDHLQRGSFDFMELKILVLDEADRMVDMGFLPDVEKIIGQCPIKRQTLLFSATTSQDVAFMEKKYMNNPITIAVEQYVDASLLKQVYYDAPSHMKFSLLVHLLKNGKSGIIMVFCNTRKNVDLVSDNLRRFGVHSSAIHGGLEQNKRSRIMERFHKNEADILVCTDVAARGLDIKGVTHVYNYDVPKSSEEYIHRIGRTARAGEKGMAVTLVSNNDYMSFRKVLDDDSLKIEKKEIPENMEKLTPRFKEQQRGYGHGRAGGERRGSYNQGRRNFGERSRNGSGQGRKSFSNSRSGRSGERDGSSRGGRSYNSRGNRKDSGRSPRGFGRR